MFEENYRDHIDALTIATKKGNPITAPFDEARNEAANWNKDRASQSIDEVS